MNYKLILILLITLFINFSYCEMSYGVKKSQQQQTQLEKRQFQTRTYQEINQTIAMKAILNTLQDEGFIVYNANTLLGVIIGNKEINAKGPKGSIILRTEATVNITEIGKLVKIRINLTEKWINAYGNTQSITEIKDEKYYQDLFSKIDKAIFIAKQGI